MSDSKPVVSPRVRKGGGRPTGFDKLKEVFVYAKPSSKSGSGSIKKDSSMLQGVWSEYFNAVNPVQLWIFEEGDVPESLAKSGHQTGQWGYSPGADPDHCDVEDFIFLPPKAKPPRTGFIPKGIWTYPLMKRDETALEEKEAGFIHVGKATKNEPLDVAGNWKMLYHRPGTEKPKPLKDMKLFVKKPNGEKIALKVKPDHTIDDVKEMVTEKTAIPKDEQRLRFEDKSMQDTTTLEDHGVKDADVLDLEPMEIFVQDPNHRRFTLTVDPSDTIENVKRSLEKQEKIPIDNQRLTYNEKPCVDNKSLRQHGIKHHSTLFLEPMVVYVRTPAGNKITLEVEPTDSIQSIKKKIQDKENVPVSDQRLSFRNKPLKDDSATLDSEGIKHKETIDMAEQMIVFVKTPDGNKLTFNVEPEDTIQKMKEKIEKKENIPTEDQRLAFRKKPLHDNSASLKDEGIKHKETIDMEPMHIVVKDWNGKKFPIYCEPDDTIDSIKEQIQDKEGHPKQNQFLFKEGKPLDDHQNLRDLGIKHKDMVDLDRMKIIVRDEKGKQFTLDVDPKENIPDVKKGIEKRKGHPVSQQILKFHDKPLDDAKNLQDHGIQYMDMVDLGRPVEDAPMSPKPQETYTIQLSPYKSPFEQGYRSPPKKKRDGIRAKSKELFKNRWHADLESEHAELAKLAEEKKRRNK